MAQIEANKTKSIALIAETWYGDLGGRKMINMAIVNELAKHYEVHLITLDTKISKAEVSNLMAGLNDNIKIHPFFFSNNI